MQGIDVPTTSNKFQRAAHPRQQKEQERASGTSSSSMTPLPAFVGQEVFANGCSQKKPSGSTSVPSSSSTSTRLDASSSGGAAGIKAAELDPTCSRPVAAVVVDKPSSPSLDVKSSLPAPGSSPSTSAAPETVRCEYPGCSRPAKYRQEKDAPPSACQAHKKKGQYTINRRQELLIATRDGEAFRTLGVKVKAASSGVPHANGNAKGSGGGGGGSSATPSRRKQAAKPRSSSMKSLKGSNQPGPSRGREVSQEPQGRPCLFPGCDTQPSYGLPGAARAVYCLAHKKVSMMPITEKPLETEAQELERKTVPASVSAVTQGKDKKKVKKPAKNKVAFAEITTSTTTAITNTDEKATKKSWPKPEVDVGVEDGSGDSVERGTKNGQVEGATVTGDVKLQGSVHHNTHSSTSIATSAAARDVARGQPSTTAAAINSTQGDPAASTPPPPPSSNRMADTSGLAPSVEMLLVRQARETAKKEARASGRRPRAPSRRALEASGKMQGEGAQWMTREKRAEEARKMAELREQRKLYKEAGLKFGVVVESLEEPAAAVSAEGGNTSGGSGGAQLARSDPDWQKVPAALLVASPQLESITRGAEERPIKRAKPNSAENNA
ncbi:unnamed protein product [Scytosiphon promiscuus]